MVCTECKHKAERAAEEREEEHAKELEIRRVVIKVLDELGLINDKGT